MPHQVVYASSSASAATSALEMAAVRTIIEREACLEALAQLATEFANPVSKARPWTLVRNLTRQYRRASVAAVEAIRKWEEAAKERFLWKQTKYLCKMTGDCIFFATATEMLRDLNFTLEKNPLLAPVTLDDAETVHGAALVDLARRRCPDADLMGDVHMEQICNALEYLAAEGGRVEVAPTAEKHIEEEKEEVMVHPENKTQLMQMHIVHAKQALTKMEARRKELGEQIQRLQTKMERATVPSQTRALQTQLHARTNELKALMGDLFKRRNELARQEAAFRLHVKTPQKAAAAIEAELRQAVEADSLARERLLAALEPPPPPLSLACMNEQEVFEMIKGLGLDDAAQKMKDMGIDGGLLAESTDADLQEVGVAIRLHRVKILRHVQQLQSK
ncbi:Aste57867_12492 [Aphanomyces stellatus]|uniref:Aste57867_12492 protein n=1 Tax=Aphanomyces stellatus TaxID=120398 RepID=A0A485KWC6_9STRA|nr:hypothetical protein As57867_012446 [Aphanomyces stellatus]VFT89343.1 Aste57867_12492 [Aphanomyces stellatus]